MLTDHNIQFQSLDLDQEHCRSCYQKIADMRQEAQSTEARLRFQNVKEALETTVITYRKAIRPSTKKKPGRPMICWTKKGYCEDNIRRHSPRKVDSTATELFQHTMECESRKISEVMWPSSWRQTWQPQRKASPSAKKPRGQLEPLSPALNPISLNPQTQNSKTQDPRRWRMWTTAKLALSTGDTTGSPLERLKLYYNSYYQNRQIQFYNTCNTRILQYYITISREYSHSTLSSYQNTIMLQYYITVML